MAEKKQPASEPLLEWIAAGLGLAVILFVAVVIGREALIAEPDQLPALTVQATRVSPSAAGFVVEFEVVNHASGTAAAVEIEGELGDETSSATLDYVAGNGRAEGGLFFKNDPRGQKLELRALGFQTP
jgi:uncharacterized protein (TIGR02588 family)